MKPKMDDDMPMKGSSGKKPTTAAERMKRMAKKGKKQSNPFEKVKK